jgi:hypothetical protein
MTEPAPSIDEATPLRGGLLGRFQRFDASFKAFRQLSGTALMLSFVGWLVGSLIQYNSWRGEHDLKRYEGDLKAATQTFADISDTLSKAVTLQQIVVFNYDDAIDPKTDDARLQFLWRQAGLAAEEYRKAQIALRESIDTLIRRAEIYIDWPSSDERARAVHGSLLDPLTITKLESSNIDCDKLIAPGEDVVKWSRESNSTISGGSLVDWGSAKHHVTVIYVCFRIDHRNFEWIRRWVAEPGPTAPKFTEPAGSSKKEMVEKLKRHFDMQLARLDKFMVLAMTRIDAIRRKNVPPGYSCHLTGLLCGDYRPDSSR